MICPNCGKENEENARFCLECGQQLNAPVAEDMPVETAEEVVAETVEIEEAAPILPKRRHKKKKKTGLWIGLGSAAAVVSVTAVVLAIVMTLTLVLGIAIVAGTNSPKSVVKNYVNSALKPNSQKMYKHYHDAILDGAFDSNSALREYLKDRDLGVENIYEMLDKNYRKWTVEYKITKIEDASDYLLDSIQARYQTNWDLKVKKAKLVDIHYYFEADGTTKEYSTRLCLVKIGGKWYVEPSSDPINALYMLIYYSNSEIG